MVRSEEHRLWYVVNTHSGSNTPSGQAGALPHIWEMECRKDIFVEQDHRAAKGELPLPLAMSNLHVECAAHPDSCEEHKLVSLFLLERDAPTLQADLRLACTGDMEFSRPMGLGS